MIDWQSFHFLRPEWFLALAPLTALFFGLRFLRKQQSGWQSVLAGHLYQHIVASAMKQQTQHSLFLVGLAWLISLIALAGPTWERLPQPVYQLNTGKVVLMDMSLSMRSTDVSPDRLSRAKFKAIDLVKAIGEGDTGLVAYAGDAFVISPLSSDVQNLTTLIPSLSPEIMPVPGSDPYSGLFTAKTLLENAGFNKGEIFWITDGIDDSQIAEIRELISQMPFRVSVLAVGTADGAPIKMLDGELLKDRTGAIVIPQLNASPLENLAKTSEGRFAPLQPDDSDVNYLTSQSLVDRSAEEDEDNDNNVGDDWKETGPYLVLLLLPIAAYGFRRGLLPVALITLLPLGYPYPAQADWWSDLWRTRDQQGMQAYDTGDFDGAAKTFNDPMWRGTAQYKAGDYEGALESFSKVDTTEAVYNRGNALANLGDITAAIDAYDEVLRRDPEHEDAKANKDLLEKQQQQQQEQQEQQDKDQQQNDEQQGSEQQQQQGSNQDPQQDEQSSSQQSSEDSQPQDSDPQQQQQSSDPQTQQEQSRQSESESQQQGEEQTSQEQQAQLQNADELSDEEKEKMQRMQNLLRKVPDDPSYLLKRKMQLEYQQRRQQRLPGKRQEIW